MIRTWALAGFLGLLAAQAEARNVAIGDSLAIGFGGASHMTIRAKVGISSCAIRGYVPFAHFDGVLISAGTNDPPGRCVAQVRALVASRVHPSRVRWVVPVNGAKFTVLAVARRYGDELLYYSPQRGRGWPHPRRYFDSGM